ncbi:MAG: hypothetical protein OXG44_12655 [Gammaproteobacteria bacterium]|nr:hypothetical protein [Gammaproteobacteria bacterium]
MTTATILDTRTIPIVPEQMRTAGGVIAQVFAANVDYCDDYGTFDVPSCEDTSLGWFFIPDVGIPVSHHHPWFTLPDWHAIHTSIAQCADAVYDRYRDSFKTVEAVDFDHPAEGEYTVELRITYLRQGTSGPKHIRFTYYLEQA